MFSLLTSVLKDQWKCKIAQFLFSPRFRANNYISEMKNLQFFLNLSLFTASMCWQQQIRKCCPETEFLDQYYDCRHTLGKFQFQTFFHLYYSETLLNIFHIPIRLQRKSQYFKSLPRWLYQNKVHTSLVGYKIGWV